MTAQQPEALRLAGPLTDEQIKALMRAHRTAMLMTCKARVPECGEFSAIAQDLDWLCESLGIKGGSLAQAIQPVACQHEWDGIARTSIPPKYGCKKCHALFDSPPTKAPQPQVVTYLKLDATAGVEYIPVCAAPQHVARRTLTNVQIDRAIAELGLNYLADAHATNRAVLRRLCRRANGIKEDQHG